jgi:hypothetical protein
MPINPVGPQGAFDAISQTVTGARNGFAVTRHNRPDVKAGALSLSVPHRVAYLPLGKTRRGERLRQAVEWGNWRYLVLEEQPPPAASSAGGSAKPVTYKSIAAATALPVDGGGYKFGIWNDDSFAAGTEIALRAAEKLEQVRTGDYEPFLLVAPAVYVTALWLRDRRNNESEDSDLILPIPSRNPVLTPYKPMTPAEFFDKLDGVAAKIPRDSDTV